MRGLPIGDLRGFGRVRDDGALESLALDRTRGPLNPSHPDRALLGLHLDGDVHWVSAYVPGTNVLETTGRAETGELRVVDFMALAEGRPGQGDAVAAGRFVRIVTCTEGEVDFRMVCAAAVDAKPGVEARTVDGWYVACTRPMSFGGELAAAHVRLRAGESVAFVIASTPVDGGPALVADTLHGLGDTIHYWTWWSDRCRYKGDDFDERLRDALSLKLACGPGGSVFCEDPGAIGFASVPRGDASRAAASFLELGYRQECVDLLVRIHAEAGSVDVAHWSADELFVTTLARYVERYGDAGLPDALRDAAAPHSRPAQAG
jgi:hypothetical protein